MVVPEVRAEATVLITTKNRCEQLRRAITSVYEQNVNVDLIVVDDGSGDGTSAMVRSEFSEARLIRNASALGIIAARNRAASLARTPVLFTLDDDAVFSRPDLVGRVLQHFDHPRVGAVAIPSLDIIGEKQKRPHFVDWAGEKDFPCLAAYRGGANAKRVDLFTSLGGYGGKGRQGEEKNYCLRMLAAGYVVRAADAPAVHHFPEPAGHNRSSITAWGARNSVVFAWEHAPLSRLGIHWAGIARNQVRFGLKEGQLGPVVAGMVSGVAACKEVTRRPVPEVIYRLFRSLLRTGPRRFSEIEALLGGLTVTSEPEMNSACREQ